MRTRSHLAAVRATALLALLTLAGAPRSARAEPPPRNLALLLNVLGLAGNPVDDARGWRLELAMERRPRKGRLSSAVVVGGGAAEVDGYPAEWALGISGQLRWYALGDFEQGLFLGGVLDFHRIGPYLMTGAGPLAGYRYTTPNGLAVEAHFGMPLLTDSFSTTDTAGRLPLRDAWNAMLPGVFVGVGAELRTTRRR